MRLLSFTIESMGGKMQFHTWFSSATGGGGHNLA